MIRANCRVQLTPKDMDFILDTLPKSKREKGFLEYIADDSDIVDILLDDPDLFEGLRTRDDISEVSPQLFFYAGVRRFLKGFEIEDRDVADYVASLLAGYVESRRYRRISKDSKREYGSMVDLFRDTQNPEIGEKEKFMIWAQLGNYALFISGLFQGFAEKHGGMPYFQDMGSRGYSQAAGFPIARIANLNGLYVLLSSKFEEVRLALNEMREHYFES